jgi:hypothetical protein
MPQIRVEAKLVINILLAQGFAGLGEPGVSDSSEVPVVLQFMVHLVEGRVWAEVQLMPADRQGDKLALRTVQNQIDVIPVQVFL